MTPSHAFLQGVLRPLLSQPPGVLVRLNGKGWHSSSRSRVCRWIWTRGCRRAQGLQGAHSLRAGRGPEASGNSKSQHVEPGDEGLWELVSCHQTGCQPRGVSALQTPKVPAPGLQLPQTSAVQGWTWLPLRWELPIRRGMQVQGIPEPTAVKHSRHLGSWLCESRTEQRIVGRRG